MRKGQEEASDDAVEFVLVDHEISPSQALNLENEVGCEVMDRTVVTVSIFRNLPRNL
ncbi:MAG TPA: hypothetical protein PK002_07410 [Cellvibrio sp.]|nr:hypothetical protein [Cellvibrio sp.]